MKNIFMAYALQMTLLFVCIQYRHPLLAIDFRFFLHYVCRTAVIYIRLNESKIAIVSHKFALELNVQSCIYKKNTPQK